jgi:uncharacterized membrane protein
MIRSVLSQEQRAWLLVEMDAWAEKGIITGEQVHRILDLYESPTEITQRHKNTAVFVLMSLAAGLVGLAVILFFAFNWTAMPAALKLALIFGVIGGTHGAGFYLRYKRQVIRGSEVLFLLGCIFYGAGIALVAQIFHLNAHAPDGVWWWAIGVLPFALCLDTALIHVLFAVLLAIWGGMELLGYPHLGGWFFVRWHWMPNFAPSLPLLAVLGLVVSYRKNLPFAAALYAPLLAWWLLLSISDFWHWDFNPIYLIGAVGGLFLIVGESHRPGSPFGRIYRLWGMLITGICLAIMSYYRSHENFSRLNDPVLSGILQAAIILFAACVTVAVGAYLQRRDELRANTFVDRLQEFARRQWLPIGITVQMAFMVSWQALWSNFDTNGMAVVVPTILANLAILAASFWLMRIGLNEERGFPFAAGVGIFLLWTVLRYIDLFGEFGGMLGASCMFFLCGAALFGVALYWRKRKEA